MIILQALTPYVNEVNLKLMPDEKVNRESSIVNRILSIYHLPFTIRRKSKAFTLIELLVVISIIAILITIIIATFGTTQQKARDSRRKTDLDAFKKALQLFKSDTKGSSKYPSVINDNALVTPKYIKEILQDPSLSTVNGGNYIYNAFQGNGTSNCTPSADTTTDASNGNCETYKLTACLENTNDANKDATTDPICSAAGYASYTITNP